MHRMVYKKKDLLDEWKNPCYEYKNKGLFIAVY